MKPSSPAVISGEISGGFTGTIYYEEPFSVDDGTVSGSWTFDLDTSEVTCLGTFATTGLSGTFEGKYDWESQTISGTWTSPGSEDKVAFSLRLDNPPDMPGIDPYVFSGDISGEMPGPEGPVDFVISLELEVRQPTESHITLSGPMDGTWSGIVSGTWETTVQTPLGPQTVSDSFSDRECQGTWDGNWEATVNFVTSTISGEFGGTFEGAADVEVETPLGPLGFEVPVRGVYDGTIYRDQEGQILFTGCWQEIQLTEGTVGVHEGFGGPLVFKLVPGQEFPFPINGMAKGGGSFRYVHEGEQYVDVTYVFVGQYTGEVQKPI